MKEETKTVHANRESGSLAARKMAALKKYAMKAD